MQRRTQAILLIAIGVILLLGILIWLFLALSKKPTVSQPPALPTNVQPTTGAPTTQGAPQKPPAAPPQAPIPLTEQQAEDSAKQFANDFTVRAATYSNTDGFASITQVYTEVTPDVKTYLEGVRAQLAADHPLSGPSWGQTTRAIAAKFMTPTPIEGKTQVILTIQVQQFVTNAGKTEPATYQEADIQLNRQGNSWIVSHISWKPFQP